MTTSLLGYGAHGHDIETIWHRINGRTRPLIVMDDDKELGLLPESPDEPLFAYIGVNDPQRRRAIARHRVPTAPFALVDPSVVTGQRIFMGRGSVIGPGSVLLCDVELGEHVHVNYGVSMTRCEIGPFTTIAPGATLCGDVVVGEATLIGAGAVICDRVRIGSRVTIGAGAIVPPLSVVPDDTTVIGVWKPVRVCVGDCFHNCINGCRVSA